MVDMFEIKMCNYCKNTKCSKSVIITIDKKITSYKCDEYIKDKNKINRYKPLEFVTAKRDYVQLQER